MIISPAFPHILLSSTSCKNSAGPLLAFLIHNPFTNFLIQRGHLFADRVSLRLQSRMIPEDGVPEDDVAELRENDKYPVQQLGPMSFVNDLIGYNGD